MKGSINQTANLLCKNLTAKAGCKFHLFRQPNLKHNYLQQLREEVVEVVIEGEILVAEVLILLSHPRSKMHQD